jgi:RNA polymerase sigma-70 factor (ECF subfamily)
MTSITPERLAELLDEHAAALELFAAQWTASAADVVQEAFIELARQQTVPERVVPWLYRVVRNGALSAVRSAQRRHRREQDAAAATANWFTVDHGAELEAAAATEALGSLPIDEREVIVARLWGGITFTEYAEIAGISTSTAHRRYESGLAKLRTRLGVKRAEEQL